MLSLSFVQSTTILIWSIFGYMEDSICSSPLRARASAVYIVCNSLKFPVRRKSTEMEIIYYSLIGHYGNLCVVAIANVETEKTYINNERNINSIS